MHFIVEVSQYSVTASRISPGTVQVPATGMSSRMVQVAFGVKLALS
jgi:hypothetical protein